jgi:predicted metal-binding membrane protein
VSEASFESLVRRDRALVLSALVAVAALAWAYILRLAATMPSMTTDGAGMDMAGMAMTEIAQPGLHAWSAADFMFMVAMWAVMMVAMMLPSATPMILIYARVGRQAMRRGSPFPSTAWFGAGYLLAWSAFALVATLAQWALEKAALLTPAMSSSSDALGGAILIAAGLYQWTPLKESCLSLCQSPLTFIQRQGGFPRSTVGSLALGARHGLFCIGCCWALMALLFVGGVMNLLWIAGLAILVLLEKLLPVGPWFARVSGVVLLAFGIALIVKGV